MNIRMAVILSEAKDLLFPAQGRLCEGPAFLLTPDS